LLLVAALITALAAPAWSQMAPPPPRVAPPSPPLATTEVSVPPPLPQGFAPAWTPVPAAPRVYYAPNAAMDVFRLKNQYYYYSNGVWYRGKYLRGPWHPVRKLPRALYRVNRTYFRTHSPW